MRKIIVMLTAVMLLVAFFPAAAGAEDLIPKGMVINDIYQRGIGHPVGTVALTQGDVVIIHRDDDVGYRARTGLDLFQADTVVCLEKGRAMVEMADGSRLTLASRTRLKVNRSLYDEAAKDRSSFFSMATGKARFWITKLISFKRTEVRVITPTAVVGVRGSDFVVAATQTATQVTTLGDTELEVVNQFLPEQPPLILNDFQQTSIEGQEPPTPAIDIDPAQVADIVQDVPVTPQDDGSFGPAQPSSGTAGTGAPAAGPTPGSGRAAPAAAEPEILVEEEALVAPEEVPDATPPPESMPIETAGSEPQEQLGTIQEIQDNTLPGIQDDAGHGPMPDFPKPPE